MSIETNIPSASGTSPARSRRRPPLNICKHPDWLPEYFAVKYEAEILRRFFRSQAQELAQAIISEAYIVRLLHVVRSRLPKGIIYPFDDSWKDAAPKIREELVFTRSRAALIEFATTMAEMRADNYVKMAEDRWLWANRTMLVCAYGDDYVDGSMMLKEALHELNDADAALDCVLAWSQFHTSTQPPNWSKMDELVKKHPDLVTVGLKQMIDRGWVPPPWVTAAIA